MASASTPPHALPVTKQARAEVSTRRLLDAAQELIVEVGYERATLALIADRAGYSHGLITRRFGSKENLLHALIERVTLTWREREGHAKVTGLTGRDAALVVIDSLLDGYRRSPDAMRSVCALMFESLNSVTSLRERIRRLHRTLRHDVAMSLQQGIDDGTIGRAVSPDGVARLLVSGLCGAAYQWLVEPGEVDLEVALLDVRRAVELMIPLLDGDLGR
ncbi:TetR/AcrR family transcriptional regulator [Streptomyces scabiei]|uniref:TetR/AcrR family transcriptional regulator n=1 Tax=Streptomyces scabiei TaxID=1930 RepID=UPI003681DD9E